MLYDQNGMLREIHYAVQHLVRPNQLFADAVDVRQLGMMARYSAGEAGWSQDHHKVYELVVRHFLACVSQPAVGAEITVEVDVAGEQFSAAGRVIIDKNYLDVYWFETWGGSMIPPYNFGQQMECVAEWDCLYS